jgi:hypothetical protein
MVTATAPETIIARMPLAYAPACAFTSAPNAIVIAMQMTVYQHDRADRAPPVGRHAVSGQVPRHDVDQAGIADAPANHRIRIVLMS